MNSQRDDLETTGYDPKKENGEGSFIGEGRHKVVWRQNDFAVMNATDAQRRLGDNPTDKEIKESNLSIQKEYNFTVYLHSQLSKIVGIPKVYRYKRDDYFGDKKFRYAKELCENVVVNDDLMDEMIDLSERLLAAGWVYLDMKPDNLGRIKGKLYIVDTDYRSFYRVPPKKVGYFKRWCYFILVMYIYHNHPEITKDKLAMVVRDKKLTKKLLINLWVSQVDEDALTVDKMYAPADKLANELIRYGNIKFEDVKEFIHLEEGNQKNKDQMTYPCLYYRAYGQSENDYYPRLDLTDFNKMMKEIDMIKLPSKQLPKSRRSQANPPAQGDIQPSANPKPRPLVQVAKPPPTAQRRNASNAKRPPNPKPKPRAATASQRDIQPIPTAKPPPKPRQRAASASQADTKPVTNSQKTKQLGRRPSATFLTRKNQSNKDRVRILPQQPAKKIDLALKP